LGRTTSGVAVLDWDSYGSTLSLELARQLSEHLSTQLSYKAGYFSELRLNLMGNWNKTQSGFYAGLVLDANGRPGLEGRVRKFLTEQTSLTASAELSEEGVICSLGALRHLTKKSDLGFAVHLDRAGISLSIEYV
jgi:hypothetical protein